MSPSAACLDTQAGLSAPGASLSLGFSRACAERQRGREAWGGWRRGGPAAPRSNLPSSALRPAHLRGSLPSRRQGTSPLTQQSPCASHPTRPLRGAGTVSTWEETRHVAAGGTLPLARHVAAGELCETETLLAPPTVLCKLGV